MTDFEKVKNYYKHFDEKNRLRNDNSGKLEFFMTMGILEKNLPQVNGETGTVRGIESAGSTAEDKSIIEMCGHAMYVGVKK